MRYPSAIDKNKHFSHLWSLWLWMGGVRQHWGRGYRRQEGVVCLWQCSGRSSGVKCVFAHSGQVLLAEPEERRSFMDIRLLLARGDIGEAKSLPFTCIAGLSASWLSRHEPVGEGWGGGRRKDRDQNVTTQDHSHAKHIYISNVTSHYRVTFSLGLWIRIWKTYWVEMWEINVYIKDFFVIIVNFTQIGMGKTSRLD